MKLFLLSLFLGIHSFTFGADHHPLTALLSQDDFKQKEFILLGKTNSNEIVVSDYVSFAGLAENATEKETQEALDEILRKIEEKGNFRWATKSEMKELGRAPESLFEKRIPKGVMLFGIKISGTEVEFYTIFDIVKSN